MSQRSDDAAEVRATGGCLCGEIRYEVRGPLRDVVICHCSRCRRTHGHAAAYAACERSHLALIAAGSLRWYEADERERGFCCECGASLFWHELGSDQVSIAAGTLDPPTGLLTAAQIFTRDRGDYYRIGAEGELFPGGLDAP
jgi:hypothetical protein